jgi:hypothetical protein
MQVTLTHQEVEPDCMDRLDKVLREKRLKTLWFSSPLSRFVEFGKTAMIGRKLPKTPLIVSIGSDSEQEFTNLQSWLDTGVGLRVGG